MAIGSAWAEGSFVDASWVTAGNGAWVQASAVKTIGATSQLGAITSTSTIEVVVPKTIGAVSQLDIITSTGTLTAVGPKTLGAISQLELITSSGRLTAPKTSFTGGFYVEMELYRRRQEKERREREERKRKAKAIQDEIHRKLALEQRRIEEEGARLDELAALTSLVEQNEKILRQATNERIAFIAKEAINRHTYSKMERLERELNLYLEEEEFLMMATQIILNQ